MARIGVALLGLALLATGCVPAGLSAARNAAVAFEAALGQRDASAACQLLSDQARSNLESASTKPCVRALAQLHLTSSTVRDVQVWGDNSQALLATGALFLAEFKTGWKVTAAGCQPKQDSPYDCVVEG